ncbi:MAG TPA: hypothetical protein VHL30_03325 [Chlamydiales bacterium]|jgi:hypothetical protein|nr:hypothetical protein [Chlamydiales bacterium]
MSTGVLVGCDANQEWLLSWWYSHFREHNPLCELAFADFGMTREGRNWCKERGALIDVPALHSVSSEEQGLYYRGERWEQVHDEKPWPSHRLIYFQKPFAIQQAPFHRVLWLDLDCKVLGNLDPLLSFPLGKTNLAARTASFLRVKNSSKKEEIWIKNYNGGVILVEKDSPLLNLWIEGTEKNGSCYFVGADCLLSFYIALNPVDTAALPLQYNWNATLWGPDPTALIHHWQKEAGKTAIRLLEMNRRTYE